MNTSPASRSALSLQRDASVDVNVWTELRFPGTTAAEAKKHAQRLPKPNDGHIWDYNFEKSSGNVVFFQRQLEIREPAVTSVLHDGHMPLPPTKAPRMCSGPVSIHGYDRLY